MWAAFVAGGAALMFAVYYQQKRSFVAAVEAAAASGSGGGDVDLRLTGYYPVSDTASEASKRMEGGNVGAALWNGRKVKQLPLYTLEQHIADSKTYPYVSLSGDPSVWPFGQLLLLPELGANVRGRVVDTGGHFTGLGKIVRIIGREPIDVRVNSSATKLPTKVTAHVVPNDNFENTGRDVAYAKAGKAPVVAGRDEIVDAFLTEDYEALARMLASELKSATEQEMTAAAWATRNRSSLARKSIHDILAPEGEYGPQGPEGGRVYASTRLLPTDKSKRVVDAVLSARGTADPTGGACDFWKPDQQDRLKAFGDMYRQALAADDEAAIQKYAPYSGYTQGAADVRAIQMRQGLVSAGSVGSIELLKRV